MPSVPRVECATPLPHCATRYHLLVVLLCWNWYPPIDAFYEWLACFHVLPMDRLGQLTPWLLLLGESSASNAASVCPDALYSMRASPAFLYTHMRWMPDASQRVKVRACNAAAADGACTSTRLVSTARRVSNWTGNRGLQQPRQIAY